MDITFIIPSNKPDVLDRHALSVGSLTNLLPLAERHKVSFSVVAQPPIAPVDLDHWKGRVRGLGMEINCLLVNQDKPARMIYLRQLGASQFPHADLYVFWDDNNEAAPGTKVYNRNSGQRYLEVVDYFTRQPRCGVVCCVGPLGGNHFGWSIGPCDTMWYTERGCFFRNIFEGGIYFPETLIFKGGAEDALPGFKLIENGYFVAKQFSNPTKHHGRRLKRERSKGNAEYPENDFGIHDQALWLEVEKFVCDRYGEKVRKTFREDGFSGMRFYPPGDLISLYLDNGGPRGPWGTGNPPYDSEFRHDYSPV